MGKYKFISKGIYFPKEKILAIGDLHFGYEEELNNKGIAIPRRMVGEIMEDLKKIVGKVGKVEKIVILGDIRHSFGSILKQEREDMKIFFRFLAESFPGKRIIITSGNHDTLIKYVLEQECLKNVEVVDYFLEDRILFFHGDSRTFEVVGKIKEEYDLFVTGHFHPAIDISDGEKTERFKCFLVGKWLEKNIVVVPSFFPLNEGANVLDHAQLPLKFVKKCKIFVVDGEGEVYDWGKVK